ncbi:MerR family transcriptional regulator [Nocardia sp. 2]|uniref:MerR family transcriptional regulator n=1 Tax=Nocardia acididurans TaxID=2802282 RepID=A0ABS1M2C6_9NOCA|nr:MerR family transcriptional regulator [Nocardia acididurans]MBL1074466.1 MerR family transcriptional regulator [Nocardia acididurans]
MITIGQLATYAGVTTKAVRHYHSRGLLPEPERDSARYRRYTARHTIDLVKIKTLARAGVPLARIKDLLTADSVRFDDAVAEIDRDVRHRIKELQTVRKRLAQLGNPERLFVPTAVAEFLDRLRDLGASEHMLRSERDVWILLHAVAPEQARYWLADKCASLADPHFCELYLEHDAFYGRSPTDRQTGDLAARTREWIVARQTGSGIAWPALDPAIALLVTSASDMSSPAWPQVVEFVRCLYYADNAA